MGIAARHEFAVAERSAVRRPCTRHETGLPFHGVCLAEADRQPSLERLTEPGYGPHAARLEGSVAQGLADLAD